MSRSSNAHIGHRNKEVENYIELESIGHYLCPSRMEIYPIHTDGTADYENALPVQDIEEANGISSEDLGKIELLSLM
jgi:hypothetical protein